MKRVKRIEKKLLWRSHKNSPTLFRTYHPDPLQPPLPQDWVFATPPKTAIAIISVTGEATNFKFRTRIHRIDRNKSLLKISGKVAVGVLRLPKFF